MKQEKIRLVYEDEKSSKFWEISYGGTTYTVKFGKIGTDGQSKSKSFTNEKECNDAALKVIKEKQKKGYVEDGGVHTKKEKADKDISIGKKSNSKPGPEFSATDPVILLGIEALKILGFNNTEIDGKAEKIALDFYNITGRRLPSELIPWIHKNFPENSELFLDSFELEKIFSPATGDELIKRFQTYNLNYFPFTGCFEAGRDQSGDRLFFYLGKDAGDFVMSVYFDHEESVLSEYDVSLNSLCLDLRVNFLEIDVPEEYGNADMPEILEEYGFKTIKDLESKIPALKTEVKKYRKAAKHSIIFKEIENNYYRSYWLMCLLAGEECYQFGDEIKKSLDYDNWLKEKKKIKSDGPLFYYWLMAHFFLGNKEECRELVRAASEFQGEMAKTFAESIGGILDQKKSANFGRYTAEQMTSWSEKVQSYATLEHFSPERRSEVKKSRKGLKEISPQAYLEAVEKGDIKKVTALLDAGLDVNTISENDGALKKAVKENHIEIVRLLIERGADVNQKDGYFSNELPLVAAFKEENKEAVQILIDAGAAISDVGDKSILNELIKDYSAVEKLLSLGADPNYGKMPPLIKASKSASWQILEFLLKAGANINGVDDSGNSPLHSAIRGYGVHVDNVKILLEKGADVNAVNQYHVTPLIAAAYASYDARGYPSSRNNLKKIVQILLENGSDRNYKKDDGNTALEEMIERGARYLEPIFAETDEERRKILDELMDLPEDRLDVDLFHKAVYLNYIEKVREMIDSGINVNVESEVNKETALAMAVEYGHLELVKLLLESGAEVNQVSTKKKYPITALGQAARMGYFEIAELLIEKGADVNFSSSEDNNSILQYAVYSESRTRNQMIELLKKNGADINYKRKGEYPTNIRSAVDDQVKDDPSLKIVFPEFYL